MTKKILRLISQVTLAVFVVMQLSIPPVFADTQMNVALGAAVTSSTHPNGGYDAGVKPLSYLNDNSAANYLRVTVNTGQTANNEPSISSPIHLCMDLGSTYTIEKLVLQPRQGYSVWSHRAVTIYGSNDSTAATAAWASASDLTEMYQSNQLNQTTDLEIPLTDKSFRYIVVTMAGSSSYGCLTIGDLQVWADPSTATVVKVAKNMALPSNNPKAVVSSVSHPQGGMDGSTSNLRPLSNLINGVSSGSSYFRLSTAAGTGASNGYHEVYNPVGGDDVIIHACLDLGDMYDLTKLVITPRDSSGTIKSTLIEGLTFYGSNDPKVKTTDWQNAEMDIIRQFTADDCPNSGNYKYLDIESDYTIDVDPSNNAYQYIVLAQTKGNNKYNYYFIQFGNLAVYSTGINEEYQKKIDFYADIEDVAGSSFEGLINTAVSDGVITESSVTDIVALSELGALSEYFVWGRDAVLNDSVDAGFDAVSSEENVLYLLKLAVVLKAAAGGVNDELQTACAAYAAELSGLFSEGVNLQKFEAAYRVPQTVNAANVIGAIKFADAISFINGATAEKIAQVLTERYEDLGFDITYLTNRTTALEVAKRIDNTIPDAYLTGFGTVIVGIVDQIALEVQERIRKGTIIEPSEKGIKISIPVTGDFENCTFNITVTDPSGDVWHTQSTNSDGLTSPVEVELLYTNNGDELGEYSVLVTVVNNVTGISTPVTVKGWCVAEATAGSCYANLNTVAATGFKQAIENGISVDKVLSQEVVERIIPLADMEASSEFFVTARAGMASGLLGGSAKSISDLETLKTCLQYTYLLKALDSEDSAKITEAYNRYGSMISGFITPTFSIAAFAESYRTVEGGADKITANIGFCDALSQIKGKTYQGVADILNNYSVFLGIDLAYFTQKGVEVIEVAKKLDTNIPDTYYNDFGGMIRTMVDGCVTPPDPNTPPVYDGGGGGGGGGVTIGSETKKEDDNKTEQTAPAASAVKPAFSDLKNVPWAVEAINNLSKLNIISGVGNGAFEPEKSVKREEFAKMIVLAFALHSADEDHKCTFLDTASEDWHYTYINAACGNDVTNGINENTFGVGENITRQDLAVMCYRAALKKGLALEANSTGNKFADGQKIADYAWVAINALNQNGIINGFDDATIRPEATATRAEAAAIVHRLLMLLEQEGLV
ncbi:MAG: S-layer homology domain-containing protein [Clostridia bacterium]|nr:S-layer homology domain-containing protein [Clostridia bacterium]